jgi:hypothetical protein
MTPYIYAPGTFSIGICRYGAIIHSDIAPA